MKEYSISGYIGIESTPQDLSAFLKEANGDDITVRVSTGGGSLAACLDMYNQLKNYQGESTAILSGFAMSAGSYIPLGAKKRLAEANAVYMIHNVQGGAQGDYNEMFRAGNTLKGMSHLAANAYAKASGKSAEEIKMMMDETTFFFGQEIVDAGFVHGLIDASDPDIDEEAAKARATMAFNAVIEMRSAEEAKKDFSLAATMSFGDLQLAETPKQTSEVIAMDLTMLKKDHPELVAAIASEATANMDEKIKMAREEGIKAENARIQAVRAQLVNGHEALIESLAYDMKTTGPEAAVMVIHAVKQIGAQTMAALVNGAPPAVGDISGTETMTDDQKLKAKWDGSPELRAEFAGSYKTYEAYHRADNGVRVKILTGKGEK